MNKFVYNIRVGGSLSVEEFRQKFHVLSYSDVRPSIDTRNIGHQHLFITQLTAQPTFPRPATYNYYTVQLQLLQQLQQESLAIWQRWPCDAPYIQAIPP